MICNKTHRYDARFEYLPEDQGVQEEIAVLKKGYEDGLNRKEQLNLDLDSLSESQAGTVRHKSPHAAYALGYLAE